MKKIKLNSDGSIGGVPEAINQIDEYFKTGNVARTTNMTDCSGTNKSSCSNTGDCTGTTNKGYCSNTRNCASQTLPE